MKMMIAYKGGKKFIATSRGHQMILDLPVEQEGEDKGMTPPETFIVALGTCMGVYVLNYCKNVKINPNNMLISMQWQKASNPARISSIKVEIKLPKMVSKERKEALLKAAQHCLVHNTITIPPKVEINLSADGE